MQGDIIRLNIVLPRNLAQSLQKKAGHRKISRFIAEAVEQRIAQLEEEEFQDLLAEGYKANIPDGLALTRDFEPADLEGWDEY